MLTACYPANIAVSLGIVYTYIVYTAAVEREVVVHFAARHHGIALIHDELPILVDLDAGDVERGTEAQ